MLRPRAFVLTALAVVWIAATRGEAAVKAPPPPKEYRVKLRYSIPAARDQHIFLYDAMIAYLKSIGFKYPTGSDTDREDPTKNYLIGTLPSASAGKIFRDPSVMSALLMPPDYKLPAKADEPVKVRIHLASGLPPERQRLLSDQVAALLEEELGFQEAIAYDHRGFTLLVGTVPAGNVETLLKDLRTLPEGWLTPEPKSDTVLDEQGQLVSPLRSVYPVPIVEITPEPASVPPIRPLPRPQPPQGALEKVGPQLRALVGKQDKKVLRMEIILAQTPDADDRTWRGDLSLAAPGIVVEGRLGPLVTARARVGDVPGLADLPAVSAVRLPRRARTPAVPPKGSRADNAKVLRSLGLDKLAMPHKGVRVAVVDGDFRGYRELVRKKQLPATTRYVDLTAERNRDILPDPFPSERGEIGHGTRCALALAMAMAGSGVDFVLVRVDPAAPYMLEEVARYINGERYNSESAAQRLEKLEADRAELRARRATLLEERRRVLNSFADDEASLKRRKEYFRRQKALEKDEADLRERERRFVQLRKDLRGLRGIEIVSCSLTWPDGYPVDGSSALTRYFDDRGFKAALWFQSAGNTGGQVWAGLFRDTDGNGVMEFAAPETKLRPERWTRELNFLAWQPFGKARTLALPAGAHLRVSVQWREPHDPAFLRRGEDLYREPLARLRLVLLRQRDPSGELLPTDDMEEVSHTMGYGERYGLPQRLANSPSSATYQQTLEFTIPRAGRYALRLEGRVPRGTRPRRAPHLPGLAKTWELHPRAFVEVVDEPSRAKGRPVFLDYATGQGTLGMPADARRVVTVGVAARSKKPLPYSGTGPALNLELLTKPNVLVALDDRLGPEGAAAYGADLAAPLAAGLTARALYTGGSVVELLKPHYGQKPKVLPAP
jgi:hypothetical protein